ncbi:hypothetical protein [Aquimarina brevivitae]|uniref:Uncharacterized protein n=1 Tax=Aquimarina brevivitae TaxID=323412 RepID=A0A4V2F7E0_9FLAO|nr:hypothetical protein [Aquimarina brevivitae]RZS99489.1 hypothetical protein EV197_0708 [Aquimarina brevivitae]
MATLLFLRVLVDFGLVVLAWLVQLVIYPSFRYYAVADLLQWHSKYMTRISIVVIPLMTLQLVFAIYFLIQLYNVLNLINLVLIFLIWLSTFLQAVPLHKNISLKIMPHASAIKLVKINWIRTILWTVLCIVNSLTYMGYTSFFVNNC